MVKKQEKRDDVVDEGGAFAEDEAMREEFGDADGNVADADAVVDDTQIGTT